MCDQLTPESVVLNSPPLSLASTAIIVLAGLTSTATARPTLEMLGWNWLTEEKGGSVAGLLAVATAWALSMKGVPPNVIANRTKRRARETLNRGRFTSPIAPEIASRLFSLGI